VNGFNPGDLELRSGGFVAGVAEGKPIREGREVVVRSAHTHRELTDAGGEIRLPVLDLGAAHSGRPLDGRRIRALCGAPLVEDAVLPTELVGIAEAVPYVRMAGGVPQSPLLPAPADQDRDGAGGRRIELRPPGFDAGKRIPQVRQPVSRGAEAVAVFVV